MDAALQLEGVVDLLGRIGIDVAWEHLGGGGGGLCVVRGTRRVYIDLDADPATQLERCAGAVAALPEFETLFVPPGLREIIERAGE